MKLLLLLSIAGLALSGQEVRIAPLDPPAVDQSPATVPQAPRVDERLRSRLEREKLWPAIIQLRGGEVRDVITQVEGKWRFQMESAEIALAAAKKSRTKERVEQAGRRNDDLTVAMRREVASAIERKLRPVHDRVERVLIGLGAKNVRHLWLTNSIAVRVDASMVDALDAHPDVAHILSDEPMKMALHMSPQALGAPVFWEAGYRGWGESVAVLDTGIHAGHPMFRALDVDARAFTEEGAQIPCILDDPSSPVDFHGHGTHVSSTVAGVRTTYIGPDGEFAFSGVAPQIGKLYAIKVGLNSPPESDCAGTFATSDWHKALMWLYGETPVRVVNMSFGGTDTVASEWINGGSLDYFIDLTGMSLVIAAGNEGDRIPVGCPACALNSIAVANVSLNGTLRREDDFVWVSSSRGPTRLGTRKPDIAAPGTNILAADARSNGLIALTGTSMAAPHITGAAVLLREAGVRDPMELKAVLLNSTDHTEWRRDWGWGYANLGRAFAWKDSAIRDGVNWSSYGSAVKYYRGQVQDFVVATLTWNRHVFADGPWLGNLGLSLFRAESGVLLDSSVVRDQNVQKVFSNSGGDTVVKVAPLPGTHDWFDFDEKYALALSQGSFRKVDGPRPLRACTAPAEVAAGARFEVTCEFSNTGDLPVEAFRVQVTGGNGFVASTVLTSTSVAPGQRQVRTLPLVAPSSGGRFTVSFAGTATAFGDLWTFPAITHTFTVAAPVQPLALTDIRTASSVVTTSCVAPTADSQFTARDPRVWTWITVNGARTGDRPTFEWYTPAGTLYRTVTASALTTSGSFCFWDNLDLANTRAAQELGQWTVRILWNGTRLSQTTFIVSSARLVASRLTTFVSTVSPCSVPVGATGFRSADAEAIVWFSVDETRVLDQATVVWSDPNGNVERTWRFNPISATGGWCFSSGLPIRGTAAATKTGLWTVRVYWNDRYFFGHSFRIDP